MKEGVSGSAALLRAEPAPVITAASASAHLISRRGGGDNADKSLGCVQCVFNTSQSSEMEKTTRGEKDMYIYIYICMCAGVSFTLYYAGIFRSFKCHLWSRGLSTWGEAGRTFFSSSLERAQDL